MLNFIKIMHILYSWKKDREEENWVFRWRINNWNEEDYEWYKENVKDEQERWKKMKNYYGDFYQDHLIVWYTWNFTLPVGNTAYDP